MPAPLIGVTTRNTTSETYKIPLISSPRSYIEALSKAGGLPVLNVALGGTLYKHITDQHPDAIEHPFGLAVQWHPEWLLDDPMVQALFSAFVEAAQENKS